MTANKVSKCQDSKDTKASFTKIVKIVVMCLDGKDNKNISDGYVRIGKIL